MADEASLTGGGTGQSHPSQGSVSRTRHSIRRAVALAAVLVVGASSTSAGPPLLADDPHVVGQGNVEAILAFDGFRQGELRVLAGPLFDVTLGILDSVDLVLVASPVFEKVGPLPTSHNGSITGGFKWQFLHSERWNAAFTPTVGVSVITANELAIRMPFQFEYTRERFALGVDAGYLAVIDAPDEWVVAPYATWTVAEPLALLVEAFAVGVPNAGGTAFGWSGGFQWSLGHGIDLLASAGTGIESINAHRLNWKVYTGIRYSFDWFAPSKDAKLAGLPLRRSMPVARPR